MSDDKQIHGLMVKVMRSITAVGKDNVNAHFKFKYRSIDDAINALGAACREHGVATEFVTDSERVEVTPKGVLATCRATIRFVAPDGSSIASTGFGMGLDAGDKAANKAMAAGFKYAVFMGLCVPMEAGVLESAAGPMDDPDHHGPARQQRGRGQTAPAPASGIPPKSVVDAMDAKALRETIEAVNEAFGDNDPTANKALAYMGKRLESLDNTPAGMAPWVK